MIFIIIGEVETTSNYDITEYEFGNLIVDPRPITVTTPDASWLYDGMVHSLDNLDDIIIGGDGIAPADLVSLNDYTSVRNATAGTPNEASIHIQQYEESGENLVDARDNYAIEYIPGTIVVEPRDILLVTEGYEDVYDGETYYLSAEIFGDGVAPGDGYEIINTPTVRDVTDRINDAGVRFYPKGGSTVSDEEMAPNYVITCQYGTIRVTPRPVIVGADHGEYEYDGTDHSAAATLWVDNLAERDVMTYVSGVENCMDAMDEPVMNQATYRFMQNDEDMTHNYDITEDFDMLLITPRPILVTRYGLEEIYNGEWHSNEAFDIIYNGANGDVYVDALAPCDEATIDPDTVVKVRDVADSGTLNDMRILIRRRQTNLDASTNYDITYNDAPALVILPRPLMVTVDSAAKLYDATPLTCDTFATDNLVSGHSLSIVIEGTITDAKQHGINETDNVGLVDSIVIVDADANPVTDNYACSVTNGTLTIYPRPVSVTSNDGVWLYDGMEHFDHGYTYTWDADMLAVFAFPTPDEDAIVMTHTLTPTIVGTCTDAGTRGVDGVYTGVPNEMTAVAITDALGADVSENYVIRPIEGTLTVLPRPITITSQNETKPYDGTPLVGSGYVVGWQSDAKDESIPYQNPSEFDTPGLCEEHQLKVEFTGSVTYVDESPVPNTIGETMIRDAGGRIVTSNYDIEVVVGGELSITPSQLYVNKLVQVYPHYKDKEYNGIPLDLVSTDIHEFSNADGYRLGSFAWNFTMIDIGQVTLYDLNASPDLYATYTILDADGRDVTDSVDIQFVNDRQQVVDDQVVFEVKRIPITLRPYDVFMVYKDGAVVRPNGCELVHGSLLEEYGHEINYGAIVINGECSVNGKETVSEIDPNTVIIRDENGQDVTAYYDITYQTGRLYFDEDAA